MIRFLDFQETLALAGNATGHFFVYAEQEAHLLAARLRIQKQIRKYSSMRTKVEKTSHFCEVFE